MSLALTPLRDGDVRHVWPWLQAHLRTHLRTWGEAVGLDWDAAAIERRIREGRLVEQEWTQIHTRADDPEALVCVAREGSRPVGLVYAEQRFDRYLAQSLGVIAWIYVTPSHRGRGVGEALMRQALDWMDDRGLLASEVFVTADNAAAVHRYAAHGYRVVDHRMMRGPGRG